MFVYNAERRIKTNKNLHRKLKLETLHKLNKFSVAHNMDFCINILFVLFFFGSFGLLFGQRRSTTWPMVMIWSHTCFENFYCCRGSIRFFILTSFLVYIFSRANLNIYVEKCFVVRAKWRSSQENATKTVFIRILCVCVLSSLSPPPRPSILSPQNRDFLRSIVYLCHLNIHTHSWFMPTKYQNFLPSPYRIESNATLKQTFYGRNYYYFLLNEEKNHKFFSKFHSLRLNCIRAI